MKTRLTFQQAINWEWVHAAHKAEDGKLPANDPFVETVINHARAERGGGGRGFAGKITVRGAVRVINANLY